MAFRPSKAYSLLARINGEYPVESEYDTTTGIEATDTVTENDSDEISGYYADYPDELEPQPVVIVDSHSGPHVSNVFLQSYTLSSETGMVQVLGNRYETRTVKMYNTGTSDIQISTHQNGNDANSFYLTPDNFIELKTTNELWASSTDSRLSMAVESVER